MNNLQGMASLFKTFCHESRLEILVFLKEGEKTAKDLSKLLETSQTYVHRHIQTLVEGGLLEKNGKKFSLTTTGKIVVNSLGWVEVVSNYNSFWENHSLFKLPEYLIEGISALKYSKLITPAPKVIGKAIEMVSNANNQVLCVIDRSSVLTFAETLEMMKKGVEFYILNTQHSSTSKLHKKFKRTHLLSVLCSPYPLKRI